MCEQNAGHAHGGHTHSHTQTRAVVNRLARAIGHLERVKAMVEEGRDCAEVLVQLSAVRSALNNTGGTSLRGRSFSPKMVRKSGVFPHFRADTSVLALNSPRPAVLFGHSAEFSKPALKTEKKSPMGGFYTCFFQRVLLRYRRCIVKNVTIRTA